MPFVKMRPAAQHYNWCAAQPADHEFTIMPSHARPRETWQLRVRHGGIHVEFTQDKIEPAAQHQRQRRAQARELLNSANRSIHSRDLTTDEH